MTIEAVTTLSKMPRIFRLLKEMAMASLDEPMTFQAKVYKGMHHLVITLQVLASLFLNVFMVILNISYIQALLIRQYI